MLLSHICRKLNYKKWNFYLHGCIKYNKLKMTFNIVKMFYLMLIMSEQILLKKNMEKVTKSRDFLNVCDLGYNFYQAIINMYIVVHFENIKCFVCAHIHVTIPFTIHFSVTDLENSDRWKKNTWPLVGVKGCSSGWRSFSAPHSCLAFVCREFFF